MHLLNFPFKNVLFKISMIKIEIRLSFNKLEDFIFIPKTHKIRKYK